MKASTHSPAAIFGLPVRYVVPLFQRPYVWTMTDPWEPLWEDVRALTERLIATPADAYGPSLVAPHFLGALVLEQQLTSSAFIEVRHVVDGQQRLTTLQLLLDAAQLVVEQHGTDMDSKGLRVLVLNDAALSAEPDHVYKVWPTDRDQDAFRAAMANDAVVSADLATSRVAQAHAYFVDAITTWAEVTDEPTAVQLRLNGLVRAMREHLKLVVIDLEPGDNAQVIFETLNHRGSPLLAADLVKNFVFQIAQAQGQDLQALYRKHWAPLDTDYWRKAVRQGRLFRPRIDTFLNYWLTMRLVKEIPSDQVFPEFRGYLEDTKPVIGDLLAELLADAEVYERMDKLPAATVEGTFYYRVIQALDSSVVGPLLMWVLRWDSTTMPVAQRHKALRSVESWLVRRALCRATSKDVNRMVLDLLKVLSQADPAVAGDVVEATLAAQRADSRFWPTDDQLSRVLTQEPIYRNLSRPRLRMLLEGIEDARRGPKGEAQACPHNLTVEHVMPQGWRDHWGSDIDGDEIAALRRDTLVQILGNLTLVNDRLNPTLSNRPWTSKEAMAKGLGNSGKRDYLLKHSLLKMNADIVTSNDTSWDEDTIRSRTTSLVASIIALWPRPAAGETGPDNSALATDEPSTGDVDDAGASSASHEGKYRELWRWLRRQTDDHIDVTFDQVEAILGLPLPPSSRASTGHWYGSDSTAVGRAIRDAGWRPSKVNLASETLTFVRGADNATV